MLAYRLALLYVNSQKVQLVRQLGSLAVSAGWTMPGAPPPFAGFTKNWSFAPTENQTRPLMTYWFSGTRTPEEPEGPRAMEWSATGVSTEEGLGSRRKVPSAVTKPGHPDSSAPLM